MQQESFLLPTKLRRIRRSFEKIGTETVEKCLEKKIDRRKTMVVLCCTEGDHNNEPTSNFLLAKFRCWVTDVALAGLQDILKISTNILRNIRHAGLAT